MAEQFAPGDNPLKKYFRQPKIYITLPSDGLYYKNQDIEMPESREIPVYPMTAKDELAFKTPDSLLNGQTTVNVIQSCVPAIKNAWNMPSIDLDAILVAIRMATFGEMLDIETVVPGLDEERTFELDLRTVLEQLQNNHFDNTLHIGDMTVTLRPLTYREFTDNALKTFQEQRLFSLVQNQEEMSESEKIERFNQSFYALTELNINMVVSSIEQIQLEDAAVTDRQHIQEFLQNADSHFYTAIIEHIEKQKENFAIPPLTVQTTEEDQEKGAPESYQVPVTFDQSNFFESKS